jgi:hypothetical protein
MAYLKRKERLLNVAIARAQSEYRDARLARELAEAAVDEYAGGTFPRELAIAEGEIRRAEHELRLIRSTRHPFSEWAEEIESKGYLLLIKGPRWPKQLAAKTAAFDVERAKAKKTVSEEYTKAKTLKELNDRVTKTKADEHATRASYDKLRATPFGFFARVMRPA